MQLVYSLLACVPKAFNPRPCVVMMASSQVTIGRTSKLLDPRILAVTIGRASKSLDPRIPAIMMVSSQVTMGRASKSLDLRTFAMMMCLLHLKIDRVPKTFDPRTLTLIPQWTLEHHPPSPNV